MNIIYFIAAAIALISTALAISRKNAIHALLYLILSLLSISVIFYIIGAPFIAALEVIIYAGAIMVLFIFVIMMLNIGMEEELERRWLSPVTWILPSILATILLFSLIYVLRNFRYQQISPGVVHPKQVGISLFSTYLLAVEIAGILLLAGIIGAYHLGRQKKKVVHRFLQQK